MTEQTKLEQLLPAIYAMMLAELKMQQLRVKPYMTVRKQMQELTDEYLRSSNELVTKAMELELINPQIVKP